MNVSPNVSPTVYQELLIAYQKVKQQCQTLRESLSQEKQRSKEAEDRTEKLETETKQREMQLREALENIDRLEFNNQRLTKRVAILQQEDLVHQQQRNISPSNPNSDVFKINEELKVTRQELEIKIVENVNLSMQLSEQKEEFDRVLSLMEQKAKNQKLNEDKKEEENAIALRIAKENASKAYEERDQCLETLRSLRLEMETMKSQILEKEHLMNDEKIKLETQLSELKRRFQEQVPFDVTKHPEWSHLDIIGASNSELENVTSKRIRIRCSEYLQKVSQSVPFEQISISYNEAMEMKRKNNELVEKLTTLESRIASLGNENDSLRSEKIVFQRHLEDIQLQFKQQQQSSVSLLKISSLTKENETLKTETISLQKQINELQTQITQLENSLQQQQTISQTPSSSTTPISPREEEQQQIGYKMKIELIDSEEKTREQMMKEHYEAMLTHVMAKAHQADNKALELLHDCDGLKVEITRLENEVSQSQNVIRKLEEELSNVKDDLDVTRRSYDTQIQAMTEHSAGLSEQMVKLDNELTSIRGCKVMCGKCRTWNTISFLLSDAGAGGKLCSSGNHPTLTFMR